MNIERLYQIYSESNGISTDTRKIIPGSIFFALKGDNFDGNKFADEALIKGCTYAVSDDESLKGKDKLVLVKNVLETLQQLANYHRRKLKIPFIAITGSNGKTTTKELCFAVLFRKFRVFATRGNLNNHIGVPLSVLSIRNEEIAIIEMGANHEGEIRNLCSIAEPDFGIITNIGLAHLEGFGSPEGVKRGKEELYDFLKKNNGKAFYNSDNTLLARLIKEKEIDSIPYGKDPGAICAGKIIERSRFLIVELSIEEKIKAIVQTKLVGSYNLENIVASFAIGRYFGVDIEDIKEAIENYTPSNSRSQYLPTGNNRLIVDAYNANPSSMTSSVLNFLSMDDKDEKLIILGDMLELGRFSSEQHEKIVTLLKENAVKNVILVGPEFLKASKNSEYPGFEKVEELVDHCISNPVKNHLIFLKGSRGIKLEKLLEVL